MHGNTKTKVLLLLILGTFTAPTFSAVTGEEAAKLSNELTPFGAEKGGNAAGTIPSWEGGITTPPAGYKPGDHHPDPFAADQIQFTITAKNLDSYKAKLSSGQQALLTKYPTFKLNVYPTRRSSSAPDEIYQAVKDNALRAQLSPGGGGVENAIGGAPFPIPKDAMEVLWNHLLRYRGAAVQRWIKQAAVTSSGRFALVQFRDEFFFPYSTIKSFAELDNIVFYFTQLVTAPARLAGNMILVHDTLDQVKESRFAWTYNPGLRRARRAPNVGYDNPGTAADGLRTNDQFDMFNGAPDRYDWKLVGKQEIYVPYNSYKLHAKDLAYETILPPHHINPDVARYELHRTWVIEASLKPGISHIYAKRTFYLDEDSWQILLVDQYDARGEIWRVSEGHVINYYEVPVLWTTLEVHYDLQSKRYLVLGLDNNEKMYDFGIQRTRSSYSPDSLRRRGRR